VRAFWLTLFAIGAAAVLAFGWHDGVPFTAAAFVAFFASRVWRSVIKRPLLPPRDDDRVGRTNRFIMVTAGGYLSAGVLACIAAVAGEGQEWLYVAPCFLIMGACSSPCSRGATRRSRGTWPDPSGAYRQRLATTSTFPFDTQIVRCRMVRVSGSSCSPSMPRAAAPSASAHRRVISPEPRRAPGTAPAPSPLRHAGLEVESPAAVGIPRTRAMSIALPSK
jgi:hypothetical protein